MQTDFFKLQNFFSQEPKCMRWFKCFQRVKLGQAYGAAEIRVIWIIIETTFRDKYSSINDSLYKSHAAINLFSFDEGYV